MVKGVVRVSPKIADNSVMQMRKKGGAALNYFRGGRALSVANSRGDKGAASFIIFPRQPVKCGKREKAAAP